MRGKVPCLNKRFIFVEKFLVQGNVSCSRKKDSHEWKNFLIQEMFDKS